MKRDSVFRSANFSLVFAGKAVSDVGALLYSFSVGFYILEITHNNALIQGVYLALCSISCLIFTLPGGVVADRMHKARVMAGCDLFKGTVILSVPLGMLLTQNSRIYLILLFASGILGNAAGGIFAPSSSALIRLVVRSDQIQQAESCFTLLSSLQSIIGVLLAGILYGLIPIRRLFLIVGITYLISGVTELMIRYDFQRNSGRLTLRSGISDLTEGAKYLRSRRDILAVIGAALSINFFVNPVWGNFLPYFIRTDLVGAEHRMLQQLLTPELWSSVFSVCMASGSLAAAAVLGKRAQDNRCGRILQRWLFLLALVVFMLAFGYTVLKYRSAVINGFLILLCLAGCAAGIVLCRISIAANTVLLLKVESAQLGKVSGIMSTASGALTPLASVLAGLVLQCAGSAFLLWLCGTGVLVTAAAIGRSRQIGNI